MGQHYNMLHFTRSLVLFGPLNRRPKIRWNWNFFLLSDVNAERWMLLCSTILRITLLTQRLLKCECFCDRIPEWRQVHALSIGPHTQMDTCSYFLYISCHFILNVYRDANDCAPRVMQLYDSQPIIYSANERLNAITSVFNIVYIFAYGSKIVLFSFTSGLVGLFAYCVNSCHICLYHSPGLYCSTLLYCLLKNGFVHSFIRSS